MKNQILRFLSLSFICMSGLFSVLHANTSWNNFIINYDKNLYGYGRQTWQVASLGEGWVYFANKNGMVEFNGNFWNIFSLHNGSAVRSILPSTNQNKIFVGGINEFGFFSPNHSGKLIYTCLSDSLKEIEYQIRNIWKIHENDNVLYFQGDSKIIKYFNGKFSIIDTKRKIDCSNIINGVIYIGTTDGIFILVGNSIFPLEGSEVLNTNKIRDFLPYKDGILIITAHKGVFYYNEGKITPFITGAETFLSRNEIFSAAISKNYLALGTVQKGIVLINRNDLQIKYLNEYSGLQNNTVLSLAFDKWENLWAGLDNGIDYICLNSPLTNLYGFPYTFGTGYSALLSNDYLYLGTNRGLFYTKYPVVINENLPNISQVAQSSGQVWNLCKINNDIFCLHDRGIFLVKGNEMKKIGSITGTWTCKPVADIKDAILIGTYDGLFFMKKISGEWKIIRKIEGYYDSCNSFEQDEENSLWICNGNNIFRSTIDSSYTRLTSIEFYGKQKGFPDDKNIRLNRIRGRIYFTTTKGIYQYNKKNDRMEPSLNMNNMLSGTVPYSRLFETKEYLISLSHNEVCIANFNYPEKKSFRIPFEFPNIELIQGAENLIPISDSMVIIPNEYGFALLQIPIAKFQRNFHSLYIQKVYITYPKDSLIYIRNFSNKQEIPIIKFTHNSIRIEYGISSFLQPRNLRYQYKLNNDEWSDFTDSETKEYSKLKEGNYIFSVKSFSRDGEILIDQFSFRVLPPWYRSKTAYFIYFLLLLIAIFTLYKWDDARIRRKKLQVALEKDKQMKNMEEEFEAENKRKERQIMQLEKEKLEYDLQHKSQEMADLMINLVRKNEILNEIKSDLYRIMSYIKNDHSKEVKQMILLTNSKIDSNIQSDEVLKRIEEQFDLIHNNFMKRLQKKHPDLSLNERMMCAYLKMNLTTKEIAPLLNISIRGVETLRYRLRKKFNLNRDENLIDYLNNKI